MEEHVKIINSLFDVILAQVKERARHLENTGRTRRGIIDMSQLLSRAEYYSIFNPLGRLPFTWFLQVDEENNPAEYIEKGKVRIFFTVKSEIPQTVVLSREEEIECLKPKVRNKVYSLSHLKRGDVVWTLSTSIYGTIWGRETVDSVEVKNGVVEVNFGYCGQERATGLAGNTVATGNSKKVFISKQYILEDLQRQSRDIKQMIKNIEKTRD